ncbi:MAG: hypothetical protein AAF699_16635 [Pseudomonadota bacterium]
MNNQQLKERFSAIWVRHAGPDSAPEPIWDMLYTHYSEPHRHYHTLSHLAQCIEELDAAKDMVTEFDETEMSIWFHDIIYQYGAKDNESLSADTFRDLASGHMDPEFVGRVCEFIIATQHTGNAQSLGEAYMVDIDLSGFGLPWDGYLADSNALREEAPKVSDEQYYSGKLRFLDGLLSWEQLFQTDYFNKRLEKRARENIKRYSAQLRDQGFEA